MLLYPNCKLNIGLRIIGKRADGYHDLETLFYPVRGLHDELEIVPSDVFSFVQEGMVVDCPAEKNLIVRCYRQMREHYPQIGEVQIRFCKKIPFGAGLGGGSSDAAHTAIALDKLFHLGLSKAKLSEEVRVLGADCPFFIYNTPCYGEGIGDVLTKTGFSLRGMRLVLYKPDCAVSTREAYSGITLHPEAKGKIRQALQSCKSLIDTGDVLVNDFEQTIFPLHPEIAR